jgi:hypothetical protein
VFRVASTANTCSCPLGAGFPAPETRQALERHPCRRHDTSSVSRGTTHLRLAIHEPNSPNRTVWYFVLWLSNDTNVFEVLICFLPDRPVCHLRENETCTHDPHRDKHLKTPIQIRATSKRHSSRPRFKLFGRIKNEKYFSSTYSLCKQHDEEDKQAGQGQVFLSSF